MDGQVNCFTVDIKEKSKRIIFRKFLMNGLNNLSLINKIKVDNYI